MAYEYESTINSFINKSLDDSDLKTEIEQENKEVYRKAKAMDEIEQAYWKSNTPENFAYEFVRIFEKHFSNELERADDEI